MTFEKGKSGNPNGRPKGSVSKFTTLKDSFVEAFKDTGSAQGLIAWINSDPENQKIFYQLISKMLPREVSATVTINIEKYAFLPGRSIPDPVLRDYLVELIIAQTIHHEIKKRIISRIKGDFKPHVLTLRDLKLSHKRLTAGTSSPAVIPVTVSEIKSVETVRKKPRPKPKLNPDLERKKKRLKELERELETTN
jgi:hypothetical protein